MLAKLMQNPVVSGLLSLITILGFFITFYEFIKGKKHKEISYEINSQELIKNNISTVPKLKVMFDNQKIESLTATKIILWNSGDDVIWKEDIVNSKPLVFSALNAAKILDANIIKQNEESNEFCITVKKETATIGFKYMDKKEGAVLQVYHTAPADKLSLDCKIIGGARLKRIGAWTDIRFIITLAIAFATAVAANVAVNGFDFSVRSVSIYVFSLAITCAFAAAIFAVEGAGAYGAVLFASFFTVVGGLSMVLTEIGVHKILAVVISVADIIILNIIIEFLLKTVYKIQYKYFPVIPKSLR